MARPRIVIPARSLSRPGEGVGLDAIMPPSFGFYGRYATAVHDAGGTPLISAMIDDPRYLDEVFALADGFLFCGGEDIDPEDGHVVTQPPNVPPDPRMNPDPLRDRVERHLVRRLLAEPRPTLAICRGLQLFNVCAGGTLREVGDGERHFRAEVKSDWWRLAHEVEIVPGTELARVIGADQRHLGVNSLHHMVTDRVAAGLRVSARSLPDGEVEALEHADPGRGFLLAVQFHPEMLYHEREPRWARLFEGLVQAASVRSRDRSGLTRGAPL
jgi:putative glutamine amidotransferase